MKAAHLAEAILDVNSHPTEQNNSKNIMPYVPPPVVNEQDRQPLIVVQPPQPLVVDPPLLPNEPAPQPIENPVEMQQPDAVYRTRYGRQIRRPARFVQ